MISDSVKEALLTKLKQISIDNDKEPIYNSFVRWVCENYLELDNQDDIQDIIAVGGPGDYGVDYFVNKEGNTNDESYMAWGQVKFSETFDYVVDRSEMQDFAKTLINLQFCPTVANERFTGHSITFNKLGGINSPIRKKMTFIVAGTLSKQVDELLLSADWNKNFENTRGPQIDFQIIDINKIIQDFICPPVETFSIKFENQVLVREDIATKNKSIIGFVKASHLTDIVKKYPGLFGLNIRQSLGTTKDAYKGMTATLKDPIKKKQFWKLNNGITAVCKKFEKQNINGETYIDVENLQIVNGRQTTFCLFNNNKLDSNILSNDVLVSVRIHEISENKDDEANEITRATNTQNTVKEVDQISNNIEIHELVVQCRDKFPDFYFERQTAGFKNSSDKTKKRVTRNRLLDKEKTARAYLAYTFDSPNDAMIPHKDLFGETDPTSYNLVFKNRKINELIVPHIFTYMIDSLDLKWGDEHRGKNNDNYHNKQILHKEIVKYFMLDLIGYTMRELKDSEREKCENKLIDVMKKLDTKNSAPNEFIEIAEVTFNYFMYLFNREKSLTWPEEILNRIKEPGYIANDLDKPDHNDVRKKLIYSGPVIAKAFKDAMTDERKIKYENPIKNIILKNLK